MARVVYTDISGQERSAPLGPNSPVVTIGRATDCTIRSNRKSVSRKHAEFRYGNGQFEVIDLNSSNGTYLIINDERKPIVGREFLAPNDEVWCGDFILHFVSDEDDVPTYSGGGVEYHGGFDEPRSNAESSAAVDDGRLYEAPVDSGWESGGQSGGPDSTRERSSELERLEAEKKSIEDLASRQARELEDLHARLEAEREKVQEFEDRLEKTSRSASDPVELEKLRAELSDLREEKRRLEEKLHTALQSADRAGELEDELREARSQTDSLSRDLDASAARVEDLEESLAEKARLLDEADRIRERSVSMRRDLEDLESEVDRLGSELAQSQEALLDAEKELASSRDVIEESEALRRELDRHKRLVDEFERRNRELQTDLDAAERKARDAGSSKDELQRAIDDLETELSALRHDTSRLREERDQARTELEDVQEDLASVDDLKSEIEGLKQRLKLEKERARNAEDSPIEEYEATISEQEDRISEQRDRISKLEEELEVLRAPGEKTEAIDTSSAPLAGVDEVRGHVEALDRIVDAIERADLDQLTTIDRVRLESAIRDTQPKDTLTTLKALLAPDDE